MNDLTILTFQEQVEGSMTGYEDDPSMPERMVEGHPEAYFNGSMLAGSQHCADPRDDIRGNVILIRERIIQQTRSFALPCDCMRHGQKQHRS